MYASPLAVGIRRNGAQRYASTHQPTMRRVAERVTVAIIGLVAMLCTLTVASCSATLADRCSDVVTGTDSVPADIADICRSQH